MDDEEVKLQIEELRARRNERLAMNEDKPSAPRSSEPREEKKKKHSEGVWGILTFQAILAMVIAIAYVAAVALWPSTANSAISLVKDKAVNDFSFRDTVYTTVGNAITYLNQIKPIENGGIYSSSPTSTTPSQSSAAPKDSSDGKGGVFSPVTNNTMPSNVTFAPIVFTGSITFPIKGGGTITSGFGFRDSPIYGKPEFHNGVDIAAPEGTDILAVFDGVVSKCGTDPSLGNYLVIDHGNTFYTTYGHCSKLIAKEGAHVREGEVIAKVGSTGDSTGDHLHLGMQMEGLYFDPSYIFPDYIK